MESIKENYKLGEKIQVKVTRMVQSGAFVRLPEQAEAFLPLSEISDKRLKKPQDELELNQDIEPMIIDLRPDEEWSSHFAKVPFLETTAVMAAHLPAEQWAVEAVLAAECDAQAAEAATAAVRQADDAADHDVTIQTSKPLRFMVELQPAVQPSASDSACLRASRSASPKEEKPSEGEGSES